ncbi:hypothetical protein NEOLEDRAFT_1171731 [Neolentinus lepideus HHB14362 ss-1]|uniref:F-box domain-containing protein n=1 Tax=Neolentinus lepideus HHB14362 ss-1 TaxID=1314782 RepID=A0A165Q383_9AGAM|nr:hypothetical protein NEOLEDRAFT_1171731 [Neolentinus lepideus HHB14362 ss-1]
MREERRRIQKDIAQREWEIVQLKRRLNVLIPIASLPSELLGEIFALASYYRSSLCQPHTWREVALGNPSLWSNIGIINDALTRQVLARSGDVPLTMSSDLRIWRRSLRATDTFNHVLPHIHRVLTLAITTSREDLERLHAVEDGVARNLEHLRLTDDGTFGTDEQLPWVSNLVGPRLHNLEITGFSIPSIRMLLLLTLTTLRLTEYRDCTDDLSILHLLRTLPALGELELIPPLQRHAILGHVERYTELSQLRHLRLRALLREALWVDAETAFVFTGSCHIQSWDLDDTWQAPTLKLKIYPRNGNTPEPLINALPWVDVEYLLVSGLALHRLRALFKRMREVTLSHICDATMAKVRNVLVHEEADGQAAESTRKPNRFPHLQRLILDEMLYAEALSDVLEQRAKMNHRIKRLDIRGPTLEDGVRDRLKKHDESLTWRERMERLGT